MAYLELYCMHNWEKNFTISDNIPFFIKYCIIVEI